jgi:hypothetical protein
LIVIDREGKPVATGAELSGDVSLPPDWLERVAADQVVIADADPDDPLVQPLMTIAVPVTVANQTFVGALVANVTYRAVLTTLLVFAPGDLYVISPDGPEIVSLRTEKRPLSERRLASATAEEAFAQVAQRPNPLVIAPRQLDAGIVGETIRPSGSLRRPRQSCRHSWSWIRLRREPQSYRDQ